MQLILCENPNLTEQSDNRKSAGMKVECSGTYCVMGAIRNVAGI